MIRRQQILDAARTYVGARFKHQGRSKAEGFDCVGLLVKIGGDLGLDIKDHNRYSSTPSFAEAEIFRGYLRSQTDAGSLSGIRQGSIAMFKSSMFPCHCGILVPKSGELHVIHAAILRRRVVEEPIGALFKDLIEVREFQGVV